MDYEEYLREGEAEFSNFDEYLRVSEPHTRERASAWKTAIGLQAVDGLHVSEYLKETALRHIEGEISIDDARDLVRGYYQTRTARLSDDAEAQEADKVAVNIAKPLSEQSFSFSVPGFEADNTLFERYSWYFRNALVRANYRNVKKAITPNFEFLVRFFRNLLLGEMNQLSNRHLLINVPAEWETPIISPASTATSTPASSPATPESTPSSSSAVWGELSENVRRFILVTGTNALSVKEAMAVIGLKDRKNFVEYTLSPALKSGVAVSLYPDKPNHPRQKYRLTARGLALLNENKVSENQ